VFGDPPAGGELAHQRPIEFAARRVLEILETRQGHAQLGLLQTTAEFAIVAREVLGVDEQADPFVEAECPDRRVLQLRAIGVGHRAEPEGAEAVERRFGQHGRSPSVSDGS
jgi:hypothetical protein